MIDPWYCVSCNECGTPHDIMPTVKEARRVARQDGWEVAVRMRDAPDGGAATDPNRTGARDYCPAHRLNR